LFNTFLPYIESILAHDYARPVSPDARPGQFMPRIVERVPNARWYNRCWRVGAPPALVGLANTIKLFFNPIILSLGCELLSFFFYHSNFSKKTEIQLQLMKMHHFVIPPMVTLVGLYVLFKRRRPGLVVTDDTSTSLGSFYGMPSGDVMLFTIIGAAVGEHGRPICGAVIPFIVSLERLLLGLHDITQVVVGMLFGFVIYRAFCAINEVWAIVINWVLAFFLPLTVFFDPELKDVRKGDFDNLQGWAIIDMGYLWFDVIYCAPPELRIFGDQGIRLTVAVVGAILWHVAYYYQSLNGISLSRCH
jgi:membrane-associated phospholipid phosphatase